LDRILVAGYNYIRNSQNLAAADKIGIPFYYQRLACQSDAGCIAKSQIREIEDFVAAGAPVALPGWLTQAAPRSAGVTYVPLASEGGTLLVPVTINEQITLKFVLDSGAADVSLPADVVLTLMRTGTLSADDFLGQQTYILADGSKAPSQTLNIRTLRVGDRILHNVKASIAPVQASLLLGQSFLSRFGSWSIDNRRQTLVLK
jgi:predicted aspartyl protease